MQVAASSISIRCTTIDSVEWQQVAQLPAATVGAPMVFRVPLAMGAAMISELEKYTQPAEQQRAASYYQARHAERFLLGRATLRLLLGGLLHQPAETIALATTQTGKLYCVNATGWHLSISYDDAWLVLALAQTAVGVDIEKINQDFPYADVAASCFSGAEQQQVEAAQDPVAAFFRSWTRKEAMAKALGTGIDDNFSKLPALDGTHAVPQAHPPRHSHWVLRSFAIDAHHLGALAYPDGAPEVAPAFYDLNPLWYQPYRAGG